MRKSFGPVNSFVDIYSEILPELLKDAPWRSNSQSIVIPLKGNSSSFLCIGVIKTILEITTGLVLSSSGEVGLAFSILIRFYFNINHLGFLYLV